MADQQGQLFETNPAPWEVDAEADRLVATIVFPEAPRGEFDYLVPDDMRPTLQLGARVRVPLGRGNRKTVGYCVGLGTKPTLAGRLKEVAAVIDQPSLITPDILDMAMWMSRHYLCDLGPALEAVVPAGVRGQAGTRNQVFLRLNEGVINRLDELKLPAKQRAAVEALAKAGDTMTTKQLAMAVGCTSAPIKSLIKKHLIISETRRVFHGEVQARDRVPDQPLDLNPDQQQAFASISDCLRDQRHETILLHGVTGSGKTEVYLQVIDQVIRRGQQAIVLVPEISLTPQTRRRFRSRFDHVAVLHSNLSPTERHAEWQRIVAGQVHVVVGARSAIFAPVPRLGLIIIDESHEPTFKQETVPRYHARDLAQRRASQARVPLVLGSATPSLESWHRAQTGEYRLVSMPSRVLDRPLPSVRIIDMRSEYLQKWGGAVSRPLVQAMRQALAANGQIILLLNRRGFSTHIQCPSCGKVAKCDNCDIALTHHRDGEQAICHYCDFRQPTPTHCVECQFGGIRFGGTGTQRLEREIRARFDDASVLRMDTDTMRKPGSHEAALDRFRSGEVRILLGTQMIAKGLDFPNVTLVGVINADTALHLPDFRASERTFQLITQVAGRTGRGERGGRVFVQTFCPESPAIQAAAHHDYRRFASRELPERQKFNYPPYSTVVRVVFRGPSESTTETFAQAVCAQIDQELKASKSAGVEVRILGPVAATIPRLRGKYRFHMLLQTTDRACLCAAIRAVQQSAKAPKDVQWIVDADAVSML